MACVCVKGKLSGLSAAIGGKRTRFFPQRYSLQWKVKSARAGRNSRTHHSNKASGGSWRFLCFSAATVGEAGKAGCELFIKHKRVKPSVYDFSLLVDMGEDGWPN